MQNNENNLLTIKSRNDFIVFIQYLIDDFRENPENWENKTIPDYLEAMQSWIEDMDNYYINMKYPIPHEVDWKTFADILMASKIYEWGNFTIIFGWAGFASIGGMISDPNGLNITTAFGGLLTESWYALTGQEYDNGNLKWI